MMVLLSEFSTETFPVRLRHLQEPRLSPSESEIAGRQAQPRNQAVR
jgi:hypothetical protein